MRSKVKITVRSKHFSSGGLHFDSVAKRFICPVYSSVNRPFSNVARKYLRYRYSQYSMRFITDNSMDTLE